jgi:biopolymer transport protein ExbD
MSSFHSEQPADDISLNLTALMDILSNLLFFLLASYSAQAMEVQQKADLHLPASSSQVKLTPSLTITVSRSQIDVAGVPVAAVSGAEITGSPVDGDRIATLQARLESIKSSRTAGGLDVPGSDLILLLADRGTDSAVVMKVLKTAGAAGFANVKFGVLAE